jgi:ABC-type spermidine/putrescine transport system permease subunit II
MENFSNWILGFASIVMGIGGLFVAARAGEGLGYYGGLAMFAFAVAFVFILIRTSLDHEEQRH